MNELNIGIRTALIQDTEGSESRDGMDIAICKFDANTKVLSYAGANRPLYLIQSTENNKGILQEIKANKFAIGGIELEFEKKFTSHQF